MRRRPPTGFRIVALLALSLACAPLDAADTAAIAEVESSARFSDWPGFRGAKRDGISTETGLIETWTEAGPSVLWRVPAGAGYSGIAIESGRAYTLWQKDNEQRLIALDVKDGSILWKRALGPAYRSAYGDGPRSTPIIEAGRVFAVDASGNLAAFIAEDGTKLWSHNLATEFNARIPSIGYSSTPLVEGGLLLVEVGAQEAAFMAFDTATGKVLWSSQSDLPAYSSPIALTSHQQRQAVFFSASGVHALDPKNGDLLWHEPWAASCPATGIPLNAATPVFIPPDRLFVSAAWGDKKGGGVLRVVEQQEDLAIESIWHAPLIDSEISTAVLVDGHLYGFKGSILVSLDAATGEMNWSARGYGRGSLIVADGKLVVLGENGNLALVAASPTKYKELATAQILEGRSWTSPSLAEGRLYLRNGEELVSVDLVGRPAG